MHLFWAEWEACMRRWGVQVCFCVRVCVFATACASTLCWAEWAHMCVWVDLYECLKRGSERESKRINRRVKYNEARIQREQNTTMQYTGHIIQLGELMPHYSVQSDYVLYFPAFIDVFLHKQLFFNHFQFKQIQNERFLMENLVHILFYWKKLLILTKNVALLCQNKRFFSNKLKYHYLIGIVR